MASFLAIFRFGEWSKRRKNTRKSLICVHGNQLGILAIPLPPELKREVLALEKVSQRLCKIECSLLYNSVCMDESLLPNYSNFLCVQREVKGIIDIIISSYENWSNRNRSDEDIWLYSLLDSNHGNNDNKLHPSNSSERLFIYTDIHFFM